MPIIGPGYDDPEYDNYGPVWETQDTPFRRWQFEKLTAAGATASMASATPRQALPRPEPRGFRVLATATATVADTAIEAGQAAHKADFDEWACEQQLRDRPDLAVLDADLGRSGYRL
ncbi:hypothetical protein ACWHA1_27085 [Streptomyces decoyicus]